MNLGFVISVESFLATFLVSILLGVLFLATPVFGMARIPLSVRVLFVFALSICLAWPNASQLMSASNSVPTANTVTAGALFMAALAEVFIGATLAFGVHCAFAAFSFGGKLIDLQIGLGIVLLTLLKAHRRCCGAGRARSRLGPRQPVRMHRGGSRLGRYFADAQELKEFLNGLPPQQTGHLCYQSNA